MADHKSSIHELGLVGHIEDIVVNKDQQGKKLGLRIIEALDFIAEKIGCYKVRLNLTIAPPSFPSTSSSLPLPLFPPFYLPIPSPLESIRPQLTHQPNTTQTILDCSETNEGFYVKCGYKRAGLEMAHYYDRGSGGGGGGGRVRDCMVVLVVVVVVVVVAGGGGSCESASVRWEGGNGLVGKCGDGGVGEVDGGVMVSTCLMSGCVLLC